MTSGRGHDRLERKLLSRHVQLIAIGGTIGVGLFLGSAHAIQLSGPGLLLGYAIGGAVIFFIMRALGELLTYRPVSGAFAAYAHEFIGPFAGYVTGWSYWLMWVSDGMAEVTAIGIYSHFWFPETPQWIPAVIALAIFYGVNLFSVRVFGELEFWFASLKVLTIVTLIIVGLTVIVFHIGHLGATAGFDNLWNHGGFLPFGLFGVLLTLQTVMFSYGGVEMVGVAAGEAETPEKTLPRATNAVMTRILIFYLGALTVIMSLVPWNTLRTSDSPFVIVFQRLGFHGAADVVNLVVISAAASALNSGLYTSGRMLFSLASEGQAWPGFARLTPRHVPAIAVHVSAFVVLAGVLLNYVVPARVFVWVTSISLMATLWTWWVIVVSHYNYRRAVRAGLRPAVKFRMPGAPVANFAVLAFLILVVVLLGVDHETRIALYVAPVWF
ncbi:MAG TPA: amino acid permease, partial [Rhizomicrobium sp.]|nr:amino acid permease [Rhizomicrobium sp.]